METSLANKIRNKQTLTDTERESLVALFGRGCQQKRKGWLSFTARCVPDIPIYGIYGRVMFRADGSCHYVAGQSYPDEIRTVRELLCGR